MLVDLIDINYGYNVILLIMIHLNRQAINQPNSLKSYDVYPCIDTLLELQSIVITKILVYFNTSEFWRKIVHDLPSFV